MLLAKICTCVVCVVVMPPIEFEPRSVITVDAGTATVFTTFPVILKGVVGESVNPYR
jgi:hypothetical protein